MFFSAPVWPYFLFHHVGAAGASLAEHWEGALEAKSAQTKFALDCKPSGASRQGTIDVPRPTAVYFPRVQRRGTCSSRAAPSCLAGTLILPTTPADVYVGTGDAQRAATPGGRTCCPITWTRSPMRGATRDSAARRFIGSAHLRACGGHAIAGRNRELDCARCPGARDVRIPERYRTGRK